MTTAAGAHVVPIEPASLPQLRAADRGVASSLESVLADNTRRGLRCPVADLHRLVRRGGPFCSAGRAPHRGPLPGRPRRLRRQHRHPAPRS